MPKNSELKSEPVGNNAIPQQNPSDRETSVKNYSLSQIDRQQLAEGMGTLTPTQMAMLSKEAGNQYVIEAMKAEREGGEKTGYSFPQDFFDMIDESSEEEEAQAENLNFIGKIFRFFSKEVEFTINGAVIKGKNGYQARGGKVPLFDGAVLDLTPAEMKAKINNKEKMAQGSKASLIVSPKGINQIRQGKVNDFILKESGKIYGSSSHHYVFKLGGDRGRFEFDRLIFGQSPGNECVINSEGAVYTEDFFGKDVEFPLNHSSISKEGIKFSKESIKLSGLTEYDSFFQAKNPVATLFQNRGDVIIKVEDNVVLSDSLPIKPEDGDPMTGGKAIITKSTGGGLIFSLEGVKEMAVRIKGNPALLHDPYYDPSKKLIGFSKAEIFVDGFDPICIDSPGFVNSNDFEGTINSKEVKVENGEQQEASKSESSGKATGSTESSNRDSNSGSSDKQQSVPKEAVLGGGFVKLEKGFAALRRTKDSGHVVMGIGNFTLLKKKLVDRDSGDEIGTVSEAKIEEVPFIIENNQIQSDPIREIETKLETEDKEDISVGFWDVTFDKQSFHAGSVDIEYPREETILEEDINKKKDKYLPFKAKIDKYDDISFDSAQNALEGAKNGNRKSRYNFKEFLGFLDGYMDFERKKLHLEGETSIPEDEENLFSNSAISLFEVPLPPPVSFISFYLDLKPYLKLSLKASLDLSKSQIDGLKESNVINMEGNVSFGAAVGVEFETGLNVGIPYLGGVRAGIFGKAGIGGPEKKEEECSIEATASTAFKVEDGKLKQAEDLTFKIDGKAALKGEVGFRAKAKLLFWDKTLYEHVFKEWKLAEMEFGTSFTRDHEAGKWNFGGSDFTVEGFGKRFSKEHNAKNHIRTEIEEKPVDGIANDLEAAKRVLDYAHQQSLLAVSEDKVKDTGNEAKKVRESFQAVLEKASKRAELVNDELRKLIPAMMKGSASMDEKMAFYNKHVNRINSLNALSDEDKKNDEKAYKKYEEIRSEHSSLFTGIANLFGQGGYQKYASKMKTADSSFNEKKFDNIMEYEQKRRDYYHKMYALVTGDINEKTREYFKLQIMLDECRKVLADINAAINSPRTVLSNTDKLEDFLKEYTNREQIRKDAENIDKEYSEEKIEKEIQNIKMVMED